MDFGTRLTKARTMRGWTKQDLADGAGITTMNVWYLEHGHREPRLSTLRRIRKALGVSWEDLLGPL